MDALTILLSRVQMGLTLGMHIIFPALNIGLSLFIAIMEGMWLATKNPAYLQLTKFWTKLFAIPFGIGVVSGVVLSYELGTNFGQFTNAIGSVLGSLFTYEVLTAFFLEAGFLGIMLFGWNRVGRKMHFFATLMVMIGTFISASWIMAANSWMQTPAGYHLENGKFYVDSFMQVIFNPSFVIRFLHMVFAAYVSGCFFVAAICAWYLLKKQHIEIAKIGFSFAMWVALIIVPMQAEIGDTAGLIVHKYQPLKTAAIEGVWDTQKGAPLVLIGYPDSKQEKNLYTISIPYGASLFNTHSLDGELIGLKTVPPQDRPVVAATFFGFRVMVGIGLLFLTIAIIALCLRPKGRLYEARWFQWLCVLCAPLGMVATVAGWITAECGRQPWIVYNLMRTSEGVSNVPAANVALSLSAIIVVYLLVFGFFIHYLFKFIRRGPESTVVTPFVYMGENKHG
jgi:cytochrome d ubiquinol oxidase subunit I